MAQVCEKEKKNWVPPSVLQEDSADSADPSSMQDASHIWTQLNDLALHEFSWLSG